MNKSEEIQVGSIFTDNYEYLFSSVYISLAKEFKSEKIGFMNEEEYLALFSFMIKNEEEVLLFIDIKKLIEALGKEANDFKEYNFPIPFLITTHIHDKL